MYQIRAFTVEALIGTLRKRTNLSTKDNLRIPLYIHSIQNDLYKGQKVGSQVCPLFRGCTVCIEMSGPVSLLILETCRKDDDVGLDKEKHPPDHEEEEGGRPSSKEEWRKLYEEHLHMSIKETNRLKDVLFQFLHSLETVCQCFTAQNCRGVNFYGINSP